MRKLKKQASLEASVQPAVLTPKQVEELLQVQPSWIFERTRARAGVRDKDPLPFIRLGRYLRFSLHDVLARGLDRSREICYQ